MLTNFCAKDILTSNGSQDEVGRGSSAIVRRVTNKKLGRVALKIFPLTGTPEHQNICCEESLEEAKILQLVNHENVVRFHGWVRWANFFAIVIDYISGGPLSDLLHNGPVNIPLKLRFRMFHEISKAIVYLHNCGNDQRVVHGDLKPGNIFLTNDLHIRIGDFGASSIATKTSDRSTRQMMPNCNTQHTLQYTAPEFFASIYQNKQKPMDIYSLAVNVYEILSRVVPFDQGETDEPNFVTRVAQGLRPRENALERSEADFEDSSEKESYQKAVILIKKCWNSAAASRPTAVEVEKEVFQFIRYVPRVMFLKQVYQVVEQIGNTVAEHADNPKPIDEVVTRP